MSTSTALTTAPKLYEPTFNPNTNNYKDECPWIKGWRGPREPHKCFCNANVLFSTRGVFNQHIRSGKHQEALKEYNKEKEESNKQEKEFRITIEKLERDKTRVLKDNFNLRKEVDLAKKHTERQSVVITNQRKKLNKQKTKNTTLNDKSAEQIEYIEILEAESTDQRNKISELEEYIKIIEHRHPPPSINTQEEEEKEKWYELSDEED